MAATYQPVQWVQSNRSKAIVPHAEAEHMKISAIKALHPFKYKGVEWKVTATVLKVDPSWWYNACKKCMRTAKSFHGTFRCSANACCAVGAPAPRYKLSVTAGDETGETEFVMFGRIAQWLTKKPVDTLIASNPPDFIPKDITNLLEKTYIWNVSFTQNTIATGVVSFQVNSVVAEVHQGTATPVTPVGSQSSSLMLTQDASSSMHDTPQKSSSDAVPSSLNTTEVSHASSDTPLKSLPLSPGTPATPESHKAAATGKALADPNMNKSIPAASASKPPKTTTKKWTWPAPKRAAKRLFSGNDDDEAYADNPDAPAYPSDEAERE